MPDFWIVVIFMLFAAWREYSHVAERKDLYNRIMAKDLTDYTSGQRDPPKSRNFVRAGRKKSIENLLRGEEDA